VAAIRERVPAVVKFRNVLTIDLEEWFHVTNFEPYIKRDGWGGAQYPTRIQHTLPRLLDLLAEFDAKATFFTLGWVARHFPDLVRRMVQAGHELASHGDEHRLVTKQTPEEFRKQLVDSRDVLQQVGQAPVYGHRAPTYSLRKSTDWAFKILLEGGFQFDSSVFPFGPRLDKALCDSRFPCRLGMHDAEALAEYPLSTMRVAGCNIPVAGGGYFRLLPYPLVRLAIQQLNAIGQPAIMYLHPWELDPEQPRVPQASWLAKFRHYHQIEQAESKMRLLLGDFQFGSVRDVFWSPRTQRYELVPQLSNGHAAAAKPRIARVDGIR
jgi:polysaccharide deacetylase family protein (PEP-CTERM system associated)